MIAQRGMADNDRHQSPVQITGAKPPLAQRDA
jgi:hypothetical protein